MKLLFDIGNTRLKWAYSQQGKIVEQGAIIVSEVNTDSLEHVFAQGPDIDTIWVSSVNSASFLKQLVGFFEKSSKIKVNVIEVSEKAGQVSNNYTDVGSLGVDRWVAAIGARSLYPHENLIIIDVGTAITVDLLTAEGSFEGGVILPGAQLMHDSLVARTAGIKSVFSASAGIVGKTTSECVNSGVLYGLGGAIDRVVEEMVKTLESSHVKDKSERIGSQVLVTGGGAPALRSRVMSNGQNHSDLVLLGVQEFAFQTTGFLS